MAEYANPEVLVTTDWVNEHLDDPKVRIVEIDVDTKAYEAGHVPGAIGWNWQTQLQNQITRDILDRAGFEALLSASGIRPEDTVVLYGDNNNWFAAYGFWLLKLYGHHDVRLMDGGRMKWLNEDDKKLTTEVPAPAASAYTVTAESPALRAQVSEVLSGSGHGTRNLLDVRSPDEFSGKVIAPPGMSETAQRGGHIPGAVSVPWATAVAEDGTFKPAPELRRIYVEQHGLDPGRPTIAYCRIGERSSHSWFVLRYLLGFEDVKNYDGSWTEYGNLIGVPIELGAPRLATVA
jgi:thiosulfate/3-mercaptopyruvate sulfurtransferase